MKELSIEEKARRYDEAIKLAKDSYNYPSYPGFIRADVVFPELKESEDEKVRKDIVEYLKKNLRLEWATWLEKQGEVESDNDDIEVEEKGIREAFNKIEDEKQCKQKPQRMVSAEAKEAMYNKPADTVEPKYEESKTKIFDAPTPFEDKLYAFVLACEILVDPSKREFILEHSQEILDAAREQIGKEQKPAWSEEDEYMLESIVSDFAAGHKSSIGQDKWLKSLKDRCDWKPSDEQMTDLWNMLCECKPADHQLLQDIYYGLKKLKEDKV